MLSTLELDEAGFAFDPQTGGSFIINETGRAILRVFMSSGDEDAAVSELTGRFQVSGRKARSDVGDFVRQLRACRLL